ncbi:MFS transporter [Micromonospora sp. NPDC049004]|uniref:MFS transporter n=1 Tax=Micromonospora sp. NPDC049004 TaxID=3154348 RepID=UPI0033E7BB41
MTRSPARVLALAQFINSVGDGAFYVCSALFFARIIGLSPTQIGLGLTTGWAVGAAAGVLLGHLADRRGPRGAAILLAALTGATIGSFLFVRSFPLFVLATCAYACCQGGLSAARQALLAGLVESADRTRVRATLQSRANAGLAIGAALGGLALFLDTPQAYLTVFGVDAASFLVAALVLRWLPAVPSTSGTGGDARALAVLSDRPYAVITLLNAVLLLYMPLLSLVIPLWVTQRTEAPRWIVAAILVLNTLSVVLFQVRIARRVTDLRSATRLVRYSGLMMFASCGVFALSGLGAAPWQAAAVLLLAAGLQVVGEMMQASGSWEISFGLAPAGRQGQYQGFFGAGTAVARVLGPLLLTTLIVTWGAPGWLLLGGMFVAAALAMRPAVRWAEGTSRRSAAGRADLAPSIGPQLR